MKKSFFSKLIEFIKEEYKFLIFIILLYIILQWPLNYYIIVGGGTSDVSSRIEVTEGYKHKGSFCISYVTELPGTVFSYLLSYIIPHWERESVGSYTYTDSESAEDVDFRSVLDLKTANGNATYWAYTLANKKVKETSSKLYVISVSDKYKSNLKIGDQILSIDGNTFDSIMDYSNYLQSKSKNDEVIIKIIRKKKEQEIKTKLYKFKDKIILGVILQYVKEYKTKPPVNINFHSTESGPSGGLITTLEIYNQLVKKDITKGYKIAGTGTIEADGSVGIIGGIEHKILGAESSKTDYFLVPAGKNYKDALKYKKAKKLKVKLIKVKNIKQALKKLEELK